MTCWWEEGVFFSRERKEGNRTLNVGTLDLMVLFMQTELVKNVGFDPCSREKKPLWVSDQKLNFESSTLFGVSGHPELDQNPEEHQKNPDPDLHHHHLHFLRNSLLYFNKHSGFIDLICFSHWLEMI